MTHMTLLLCLLVLTYKTVNGIPDRADTQKGAETHNDPATHGGGGDSHQHGSGTNKVGQKPHPGDAASHHGGAEQHHEEELTYQHDANEEYHQEDKNKHSSVSADDDDEDDAEVIGHGFQLKEGIPWKEERYTNDWLFSEKHPALTVQVMWYYPYYFNESPDDPEHKRRRGRDDECVTLVHLKYWLKDTHVDVLLDTYQVSCIPSFKLAEKNVLKFIASDEVTDNKVVMNVTFHYYSRKPTCTQLTYEVNEGGKEVKTTVAEGKCQPFMTGEWLWSADDDDEDEDYNAEARDDEMDQDEEEEEHWSKHDGEEERGVTHGHAHSDSKPSHGQKNASQSSHEPSNGGQAEAQSTVKSSNNGQESART